MELLPPRRPMHGTTLMGPCLAALLCVSFASCVESQERSVSGYPSPPPGVSDLIYVNPAGSETAPMGTIDRPYPTLLMALTASRASEEVEAILIASAVYEETGTLIVDHPVHLVGGPLSPEGQPRVEIAGQHPVVLRVTDLGALSAGSSPVSLGTSGATVQGIAFVGGSNAIAVVSGEGTNVRFEDCSFVGDDGWVQSTDDQKGPYGLVIKDGASVDVIRGEVTGSWRPGIMVQGARLVVNGTSLRDNDEGGIRIERATGQVAIHRAEIRDNRRFGLGIYSSDVYVGQSDITDNDSTDSDGIVAHPLVGYEEVPTVVYARENTIAGNGRFGLFMTDVDSFHLLDNTITGHHQGGVRVGRRESSAGSSNETRLLQSNKINENTGSGVSVVGPAQVVMYCNQVTQTVEGQTLEGNTGEQGSYGDGISVSGSEDAGAVVGLRHNQVQDWGRYALFVTDAEGTCELENSTGWPAECTGDKPEDVELTGDSSEAGQEEPGPSGSPDSETGPGPLSQEDVKWQDTKPVSCSADWSPPQAHPIPDDSLFPEEASDSFAPESSAAVRSPDETTPPDDCEDCDSEEREDCGDDCPPHDGGENDPDPPENPAQTPGSDYTSNSCDAGDDDCEHGEAHVDCDTSDETDDLDGL